MVAETKTGDAGRLQDMRQKIAAIDQLALELADIGRGLPVIEKNVQAIRSFTHALRFGISDLADLDDGKGGKD